MWTEMLMNPFSQSNQPILLTKITERNGTMIKMTVKMHHNQPTNLFTKKSIERNVVMMKTIVRVHHHPNLNGGRTSLIKQGKGYTENPPCGKSLHNNQVYRGESIWGRFTDEGDWDFAWWILKSGTTHSNTNELLELTKVSKPLDVDYGTY